MLLLLAGGFFFLWHRLGQLPPGVTVFTPPEEIETTPTLLRAVKELELWGRSKVSLQGRVLGAKRYRDAYIAVAPLDLLLGWGPMSDMGVLTPLAIALKDRAFTIGEPYNEGPFALAYHVLPTSREVGVVLGKLRPGMLVELEGVFFELRRNQSVRDSLQPAPGKVKSRLLYVEQARILKERPTLSAAKLEAWYRRLEERRKQLDPNDAEAVKAFNEEAAFYMKMARPASSPTPR